jgi:hypothetical protein
MKKKIKIPKKEKNIFINPDIDTLLSDQEVKMENSLPVIFYLTSARP